VLDFRPISFVIGLLLAPLGLFMVIPALVDIGYNNADWPIFLLSGGLTTFAGVSLALANRGIGDDLSLKQAFLLTTLVWIILPAFAALPFFMSDLNLSYTDAYFEAMSGLTTTGSTVITGLDHASKGVLIWRALLQWLGGVGIIMMAIAVLPMLRIGGMQLFRMESSDSSEKIMPRATQISGAIASLYLVLSAICFAALVFAGLEPFDAAAHTMATIATGGFSTSDASLGNFDSAAVDAIVTLFMIIGSMPFVLYLQLLRGRPLAIWRDSQVRGFLGLILGLVMVIVAWLVFALDFSTGEAVRYASFNVVSILTGTGFATTDFTLWGSFAVAIFFLLTFVGGCAGSASCGLKIFRLQVLFEAIKTQVRRMNSPHAIITPSYNGAPLSAGVISSVMSFMFLYLLTFVILSLALALTGVDMITALSGAATTLSNVGPGLGDVIGPTGTFAPLSDSAKWLLAGGMLLGRLELFTVLVLFTPAFWRA
jgi:trk/ktr system potassium uptake protein